MVGKDDSTTITHLSTNGSDHCPLLIEMVSTITDQIKYFRFLNCWVDNPHFTDTIKTWWEKKLQVLEISPKKEKVFKHS